MDPQDSSDVDIDPALRDAVIYAESYDPKLGRPNPNAVSPAGAKGLMQLMDRTGQGQMAKLGIEGDYDPFNPELNVRLGSAELKDQLDSSDGDEALALAKYNWGAGNVKALQEKYGPNYSDIAAHLPPETQKYVPRVLAKKQEIQGSSGEAGPDVSGFPPTAQGFSQALLPVVSDPAFDTLPLSEKAAAINKVFSAKKWGPQAYDVLKQVMTNYVDSAPEEERPDLSEVVGVPPRVQPGEEAGKVIAKWKQQQLNNLYNSGISPAIFGDSLDRYLDSAGQNEAQAAEYRNRGVLGELAAGSYAVGLNVTKGVGYGVTKPLAGITRLSGFPETADTIQNAPELLGKPSRDYIYDTDVNGYVVPNADGTLRTKWQTDAEQMVGQIGSFIAGGAALRAAGYSSEVIQGSMFAVNALTVANDSFKSVYDETGGDREKAYKAAAFALPAAYAGTLGDYAVVAKWANPVVGQLSSFNRAVYIANVFARNAAVGAAGNLGLDVIAQAGEISQTGRPFSVARAAASAAGGGIAAGTIGAFEARGVRPAEPVPPAPDVPQVNPPAPGEAPLGLPAPAERTGLPAPEEPAALGAPDNRMQIGSRYTYGPESTGAIEGYAPTSAETQAEVVQALERFQKSKASSLVLTPEQAKHIPPELFTVFQVAPTTDGRTTLVTKIERYAQRDSGTVEGVDSLIAELQKDLSTAPSPENVQDLVAERSQVKKDLKAESASLTENMTRAVSERQRLVKALDEAKALTEAQTDPLLRKVAKLEQAEAEKALTDFDAANEDVYNQHQRIQPLQDRLDKLNSQLKDVLSPTYANDIKAKERNLGMLLQKRKLLVAAREKEAGWAAEHAANKAEEAARAAARGEALTKAGIEAEPTIDFTNGVQVGDHTIIPIGDKWYVVDRFGDLQGNSHDYYYDAVDSITAPRPSLERSFITEAPKEKTALSPEANAAIEGEVKTEAEARAAEEALTAKNKAEQEKKAQEYREKVYKKETKAAQRQAAREDAARKRELKKTGKISKKGVTALESSADENVMGLQSGEEVSSGEEGSTAEKPPTGTRTEEDIRATKTHPDRSKTRRFITPVRPGKHLTSNYTPEVKFARNSSKVVRPKEIFDLARRAIRAVDKDTPIVEGARVPRRTLGFLNPRHSFINIGRFNDVMTLTHELFHGIDRKLIGRWDNDGVTSDWSKLPKNVIEAAKDMADTYYPQDFTDPDRQIQEGLAMFFQHYTSGQPYRKEIGDWYHESFAKENPETYKALEGIKEKAFEYYNQTPTAAEIGSYVEKPNRTKETFKKYTSLSNWKDWYWDRKSILTEMDKATGGRSRFRDIEAAVYKNAEGITDSYFKTGEARPMGVLFKGRSLKEAIGLPDEKVAELQAYMGALNKLHNYYKEKLEPGTNLADVEQTIADASPDIIKAAKRMYEFQNKFDDMIASTSPEAAYVIATQRKRNIERTGEAHGYYTPFEREGHGGFSSTQSRTGSTRSIINPLSNLQEVYTQKLATAYRSLLKQELIRMADMPVTSSYGTYVHEVTGYERIALRDQFKKMVQGTSDKAPTNDELLRAAFSSDPMPSPSGKDFAIEAAIDGNKLRFFEVDKRYQKALSDALPDFVNNPVFKVFRLGARVMRVGATALRTSFQAKNALRDPQQLYLFAQSGEGGFKDMQYVLQSLGAAYMDIARGGQWSKFAEQAGIQNATRFGAEQDLRLEIKKKVGEGLLDTFGGWLDRFEKAVSTPEQATRLAGMMIEAKKLGLKSVNGDISPMDQLHLLLAYKRSTTNFQVQGGIARWINMQVPFFTANIAELSRIPVDWKRNPRRLAATALGMTALGVWHAIAHSDHEGYQETNLDQKMKSILLPMDIGGVERMVQIPLGSWLAKFWSIGQIIGGKMSNDPKLPLSYRQMATAIFANNVSPVNSAEDLLGPWGKEFLQQWGNYDTFTNRAIVPPSLQYQSPGAQYTEMTSELAKDVGALTNISPIRIDHVIRSTSPVLQDTSLFMDRVLGYKTNKDTQSNNFLLNAFVRMGTTAAIADRAQAAFTNELLAARANKYKETPEEGQIRKKLEKMNTDMSNINTVLTSDKFTQDEREELRRTRVKILKEGIAVAKGEQQGPVTQSGTKTLAKEIRKERADKLRTASAGEKKAYGEGALSGSTE